VLMTSGTYSVTVNQVMVYWKEQFAKHLSVEMDTIIRIRISIIFLWIRINISSFG
jgi:hypothetical protein